MSDSNVSREPMDPFADFNPPTPNRQTRRRMDATARRIAQKAAIAYKEHAYREALRELIAEWEAPFLAAYLAAQTRREDEEE